GASVGGGSPPRCGPSRRRRWCRWGGGGGAPPAPRLRFPYRGWLLDLDGTIYLGERLIAGAELAVRAIREAGRHVAFLSNKPLETRAQYAAKLTRLGIPATADQGINS